MRTACWSWLLFHNNLQNLFKKEYRIQSIDQLHFFSQEKVELPVDISLGSLTLWEFMLTFETHFSLMSYVNQKNETFSYGQVRSQ